MPQVSEQTLRPAAPDALLGEVLALTGVWQGSFAEGEAVEAPLPEGSTDLIASLRGQISVSLADGEAVPFAPGGTVLCAQAAGWRISAAEESQCAVVRLCGELPVRLLAPTGAFELYPGGAAAVREMVTALSVLEREGGGVDAETASSYAYTLLMKLLRVKAAGAPSRYSMLIEAAVGIIDEEFAYLEGLDDLAARLEVSKPHLIRTFTKEVGISPGKYITHARIEYAKLLLSEPDMSIAFAAEATGFAGANYFAKVFRRETGLSPTEFQQTIPRVRKASQSIRDEDRLYMP